MKSRTSSPRSTSCFWTENPTLLTTPLTKHHPRCAQHPVSRGTGRLSGWIRGCHGWLHEARLFRWHGRSCGRALRLRLCPGAEAAAQKQGLAPGSIEIKYWYSGVFAPNDDIKDQNVRWYTEGTKLSLPVVAVST
jgi:hypothetical protein